MNQADTGKFIAECRKARGLTQANLAEKLNISDRAVSKWETGKSMPDSSIMLELCQILGISVNELLRGERIEMENIAEKTDETLLELKKKDENYISKNGVIAIIFTVTMLVGIMVCCICDLAVTGALTWSCITLSAILFAWIISFPVLLLGKKGVFCGMLSLSVFIIPFLYIISVLVGTEAVFRIGAVMSVLALIYLWAVYALYIRFRNRKVLATGISVFLAVPFMLSVNAVLSRLIGEPPLDVWDMLSVFILLIIAVSLLTADYARHKGLIR